MLLALLFACKTADDTGTAPPLDVSERLGAGEVRAGVITSEDALFGGISAEGRVGDLKIYNDRVQFVIQAPRLGSFYLAQGGHVIDADLVRPEGQPGRDIVEEWAGQYGLGRTMEALTVQVLSDGSDGPAVIVASGPESPVALLNGAVEGDLVPDLGLELVTTYTLAPDSWFLEVESTITATKQDAVVLPGDILQGAQEVAEVWDPGAGLEKTGDPRRWTSYVGKRNDGAVMIAADTGGVLAGSGLDALDSLIALAQGFGEPIAVPEDTSAAYRRLYGVGPDLAALTDALLARDGVATETIGGTVTSADGPVAGARVNILVDGAPYTLAVSGEDGSFSAEVPSAGEATVLAVGRGPGIFLDLPEGYAPSSLYASAPAAALANASLTTGAVPVALADGRGVADPADPLVLGQPGRVRITVEDGLPFEARLRRSGDAAVDPRLVPSRPHGWTALAWALDGEVTFPAEPGSYELIVHRGIRYEAFTAAFEVVAGEVSDVSAELPLAYTADGWLLGDPHVHASPSPDGKIPMEDRLLTMAGTGVQLHFGTDHDHIGDYRALIETLGLGDVLATVVATEMSPVLRGHLNLYPLRADPDAQNNGAWRWWENRVATTSEEFDALREHLPYEFAIQSNHPMSGLASAAGWSPGRIPDGHMWSDDFQLIEVDNGGGLGALELWLDLTARGMRVAPTGVSDSHSYLSGDPGLNATFFRLGTDDPAAYTDAALLAAIEANATIVTRGPFLKTSTVPGSVIAPTTLTVEALSPSWIVVDTLQLLRDGVVVEEVEGSSASFELRPEADAVYVVIASGTQGMAPVWSGRTPWAMTSGFYVDVAGDGWTAPLPPLDVAP